MTDPSPPPDLPDTTPMPAGLRLLQWLVIGLTASLIGGVITVIWLLVTRLPVPLAAPAVPPALALPAGVTAAAVTMAGDWIGVASTDGRLFIFNRDGSLRQEIRIDPAR